MVRRLLPAAPGSVTGTNIWINHNKNKTLPRIILPKVLGDGPLGPKSARNVAKGAGGCTLGAEKFPRVPVDVPLALKSA